MGGDTRRAARWLLLFVLVLLAGAGPEAPARRGAKP